MTRRPPRDRPGLQAERTELAWERSGLGLLAAAALLLVRHVEPTLGRVVLVGVDLALALLTVWLGRVRGRRIRVPPEDPPGRLTVADARREVLLVGWAVVAVAGATTLLLLTQLQIPT